MHARLAARKSLPTRHSAMPASCASSTAAYTLRWVGDHSPVSGNVRVTSAVWISSVSTPMSASSRSPDRRWPLLRHQCRVVPFAPDPTIDV